MAVKHSAKFEHFRSQYEKNYITSETLAKYVLIGRKRPARGITEAEYEEITGEVYDGE